ncbi:hypothetical protein RISK_000424 [Rhodopirellula islandica]|uniref:Uncharacterized protein n=1 Tax=Rhodopirellula islandica TaxID=595434 RepID=A0A0J1BLD6_RHOIS|nr:hypothetical protein RISK_000424 [Rhodopirellula islandica]
MWLERGAFPARKRAAIDQSRRDPLETTNAIGEFLLSPSSSLVGLNNCKTSQTS